MSGVATLEIAPEDGAQRLDRWFKRHYPAIGHGRLEKLLRTGQIRVNGKRARAGTRLAPGDRVRVPPLPEGGEDRAPRRAAPPMDEADVDMVQSAVIYRDGDMIALNKPPGLPVQGGSRVARHLDAMLDALRFDARTRPVSSTGSIATPAVSSCSPATRRRRESSPPSFAAGSCKNSIGHWSLACRSRRRGGSTRRSRSGRWARASG